MKILKTLSLIGALVFAFGIISVSLFQEHSQAKRSLAQNWIFGEAQAVEEEAEATEAAEVVSATESAEPSPKSIDYYLPYPGILPDHPLYWLKMLRDRVMLSLTRESTARFERLLLYADKRLGAAQALVKGRKFSLGVSTATKAEKYLEQAVTQFEKLAGEGKTTDMMEDQIKRATGKHQEVIADLSEESEEEKEVLRQTLESTTNLHKKVIQLVD